MYVEDLGGSVGFVGNLICRRCLSSRTGDRPGSPCRTPGCGGTIEVEPPFDSRVDRLPEPMTCGRRYDFGIEAQVHQGLDRWLRFKVGGDRVCSYCGSLHPDDFFDIVGRAAEAPEDGAYDAFPRVEPSDKGYKIYANRTGVRNATEGGIKFYSHHLPRRIDGSLDVSDELRDAYAEAVRRTRARFDRHFAKMRESRDG